MQAIRPNSGLNYQSLDMPLHVATNYLPDRKFKYNHIIRLNGEEFNLKIRDRIKQSNKFNVRVIRSNEYSQHLLKYKSF